MFLEIHAGAGGEDAKLFVHDLFAAYSKWAESKGLQVELVDSVHGKIAARIVGDGAGQAFQYEAGPHCVQRIPPTESRDRRQTSYVLVAVLPVPPKREIRLLPETECDVWCAVGSGPGGQHRNRTQSCVRMRHKETGMEVYIDGRHQHRNRRLAHEILSAKVAHHRMQAERDTFESMRRRQLGSGSRGDKIRTYNFIKSRAVDHRTGKKTSRVKDVIERGRFDLLTD